MNNIKDVYKLPAVVALNKFPTDTQEEIDFVVNKCKELGVKAVLSDVWAKGSNGGLELAKEVMNLCNEENNFEYSYELEDSIKNKIEKIVKKIYGGSGVKFTSDAEEQINCLTNLGFSNLPVCIAKTQYSFSDDMTKLGAPENFEVTVRDIKVSAGAGFIVALTGSIMTMPGLPKIPAAEKIDVLPNGKIIGLF